MTQNGKQCQRTFEITEDDLKFYDNVSPIFGRRNIGFHCRHGVWNAV